MAAHLGKNQQSCDSRLGGGVGVFYFGGFFGFWGFFVGFFFSSM